MGNGLGNKNFDVCFVLLLVVFAHTVNSRPPGTVKRNAIRICGKLERGVYEASNSHWCCNCPQGHRKSDDCRHGKPDTTDCVRCVFDPSDPERQTYMDVQNSRTQCLKSITERNCLKKMNTQFFLGSHEKQSRCICQKGSYSTSDAIMYGCNKHSGCNPGHEPAVLGTETTDTKCSNCPVGTYSDVSSATAMCKPFTKCPNNKIKFEGDSKSDVVCLDVVPPEETPAKTPQDLPATVRETDTQAVKRGDSDSNPWPVVVAVLSVALAIVIVVVICKRRYQRGGNGRGKRSSLEEENSSLETINVTRVTASQSEISELFVPHDESSSRKIDRDDRCFGAVIESGNATVETSRQDAVVTAMNKSNVTKDEIAGNCSEKKMKECPIPGPETLDDEIIRLLKERRLKFICLEDPESTITAIIQRVLQDYDIGIQMLKCLMKYSLKRLRPFIRNFLSDTTVEDIQSDYKGDEREIRYQLLSRTRSALGREMTPSFLLTKNYETNSFQTDFRDSMLDVLVDKLEKDLRDSDLHQIAEND